MPDFRNETAGFGLKDSVSFSSQYKGGTCAYSLHGAAFLLIFIQALLIISSETLPAMETTIRLLPGIVMLTIFLCSCDEEAKPKENLRTAMLEAVNQLRQEGCMCGDDLMPPVSSLTWNDTLTLAAQAHATDMHDNNYFSHISPDGSSPYDRAQGAGYSGTYIGENIAHGYTKVSQAVNAWKQSESHCKAMMDDGYRELGAAREGDYWVLVLGGE